MKDKFICVDTDRVPGLTLHKIYDGFDTIQRVNILQFKLLMIEELKHINARDL